MAELYECPVEGCDHSPFKTSQALNSHIRNVHPEYEGGGAREVPIVQEDFATAELVWGQAYGHRKGTQLWRMGQISFEALESR